MTSTATGKGSGGSSPSHPAETRARAVLVVAVFPLMSLAFLWQALVIEMPGRSLVVSPRAFPTLVGVLLVLVSAVVAAKEVRTLMRPAGSSADAAETARSGPTEPLELGGDSDDPDEDEITSWRDVVVVAVAFGLLVVLFERVGFLLSTLAFLLGLSTYFAPRHWLRNVIVCVLFTAATAYVFGSLLEVDLPAGIFGLEL